MEVTNNEIIYNYLQYFVNQNKIKEDTIKAYKKELELLDEFIYPESFITQTKYSISRYIERLKEKYTPSSIKKKMSMIKTFYKYLSKMDIIEKSPISDLVCGEAYKVRETTIERGEIKAILDYCGEDPKEMRTKLLIMLLISSGEKITDLLTIRTEDIIHMKEINIIKRNGVIRVNLDEDLSKLLKRYIKRERPKIAEDREEYLFKGLTRQSFRARFKRICVKAGIENEISPYDIKRISNREYQNAEENAFNMMDAIKESYIKIGIGDD